MNKIQNLVNSYFIPIWLSISAWLLYSLVNALLGDGTEYYKLVTTIVTGGMFVFWIFVLIKNIKNKAQQKIGDVSGKQ